MNRHKTFFVESLDCIEFSGKQLLHFKGTDFELPFDTLPTKGIHDYNTCEGCQVTLSNITNSTKEKLLKFPLCCTAHSNLANEKWFNKNDFKNAPKLVSNKVVFTNQHILNNINSDDWYNDLTNYIDYTIQSFGNMPSGYGEPFCLSNYLMYVKNFLDQKDKYTQPKIDRILEYIETYIAPKSIKSDINILISTYKKWLKIFPFEFSYFKDLKHQFETTLLIFEGEPIYNPYLQLSKVKMYTQFGLIDHLHKTTKLLLSKVNTKELLKNKIITDNSQHAIDLINEAHRIKQRSLLGDYMKREDRYIKILKSWLVNEQVYFRELITLSKVVSQPLEQEIKLTKAQKLKAVFISYGFTELKLVKCLSEDLQEKLIGLISNNSLPYKIAMLDYLGFIKHLSSTHFPTKYKLNKEVSDWFNSDKGGRAVKANLSSLLKNTTENKDRYTAYQHKETVIKDYQLLK